ncbi:tyrosine-type recombinase/integrase [Algibacter mikhailovii]|nr:tyrosine-type recombinase/integrase [Algibacter mikhailovii]
MKSNYSEPKIYTGGVQISNWSKLSKLEQKNALKKDWYLYYSYRDLKTLKLVRQAPIKGGANRYKTKRDRYKFLQVLQRNLSVMLQSGFNPYEYNSEIESSFFGNTKIKSTVREEVIAEKAEEKGTTIEDAFILGLSIKKKVLAESSYPKFKSKVNQFKRWLVQQDIKLSDDIKIISKKTVINYLNNVLLSSSSRNRNNSRTDINSLFQLLEDNDIISENFVRSINVLKTEPKRNKTYTPDLEVALFKHLKDNDPILYLFVQFISYNFLRPIEICRLKVKDIDVKDKKIYLKAKNKLVKTKIIPDILIKELPNLEGVQPEMWLFTPSMIGAEWTSKENNKRDYFTKQFKKVKDKFNLGIDYGLYSFRHTFITKLYRDFRKNLTPFEAKSKLKEITGHSTMEALEAYLRDIDGELPEDYSKHLRH